MVQTLSRGELEARRYLFNNHVKTLRRYALIGRLGLVISFIGGVIWLVN